MNDSNCFIFFLWNDKGTIEGCNHVMSHIILNYRNNLQEVDSTERKKNIVKPIKDRGFIETFWFYNKADVRGFQVDNNFINNSSHDGYRPLAWMREYWPLPQPIRFQELQNTACSWTYINIGFGGIGWGDDRYFSKNDTLTCSQFS